MDKYLLLLTAVLFFVYTLDGAKVQQKVFIQTKEKTTYLYKPDLPAMTEFTHCMWQEIERMNYHGYQLSISGKTYSNHYFVGFEYLSNTASRRLRFFAQDENGYASGTTSLNETFAEVLYSGWHKYCYVNVKVNNTEWLFKGYMDIDTPGVLQEFVSNTSGVAQLYSGGKLALACDQDGISADPATVVISHVNDQTYSQIAMFNMWDYSMSLDELNSLGCKDQGNVVNMDNLLEHGNVKYVAADFECPDVPEKIKSRGLFCKRLHSTLSGWVFKNVSASSTYDCVKKCSYDPVCESANFITYDSLCQLNSATEIEGTLLNENEVLHLSPYSCM